MFWSINKILINSDFFPFDMIDFPWTASREVSITRGKCNTCQHDISTYTSIQYTYTVQLHTVCILLCYVFTRFIHGVYVYCTGAHYTWFFIRRRLGLYDQKVLFCIRYFMSAMLKKFSWLYIYHQSWCKNYTVLEVLRQINIIAKIDYTVYISLDSVPSLLRVYSISFYDFCKDLRIFG